MLFNNWTKQGFTGPVYLCLVHTERRRCRVASAHPFIVCVHSEHLALAVGHEVMGRHLGASNQRSAGSGEAGVPKCGTLTKRFTVRRKWNLIPVSRTMRHTITIYRDLGKKAFTFTFCQGKIRQATRTALCIWELYFTRSFLVATHTAVTALCVRYNSKLPLDETLH